MFGRDQILVTLLLFGVLAGALALNFFARYPIAFLIFPAVILITFQRGFAGGAIGLLMAAAYLMIPVLLGDGHALPTIHSLRTQIIVVQIFVAVIGFSVVLVGAALEERKRLEQGLAQAIVRAETAREEAIVARDAAQRANRLKSMFLATMSHELRTPLNAIIGFSEVIERGFYGTVGHAKYVEYAHDINEAGRALHNKIGDILEFANVEAGRYPLRPERVDICAVASACVNEHAGRAFSRRIALELVPSAPVMAHADPVAVRRILTNLLSNALAYTQESGRVRVEIVADDGAVALSVTDNGPGFKADEAQTAGGAFLRYDRRGARTGAGLGLAIAMQLARRTGGALRLASAPGRGTRIELRLPRAPL